jgi:hypothetical protein
LWVQQTSSASEAIASRHIEKVIDFLKNADLLEIDDMELVCA